MKQSIYTIGLTDLRRNFGLVEELLSKSESVTITRKGKSIAVLTPSTEFKRKILKQSAGALRGTDLDNDTIWQQVAQGKSRKTQITL
jgi:prevent-host-death family protein